MERPQFEAKIMDNLKKQAGDIPIISISRKPIDLGKNICVGEKPVCYSSEFRQILIGLKEAKTEFCIAAESDCLYPPEYFQFTPPETDRVYRYDNLYVHFDGRDRFWKKRGVEGAQMCGREYWIKCIEKILKDDSWEPQTVNPPFLFPLTGEGYWTGKNPVLYFKTRFGVGFKTGFMPGSIKELPYWGTINDIKNNYLA